MNEIEEAVVRFAVNVARAAAKEIGMEPSDDFVRGFLCCGCLHDAKKKGEDQDETLAFLKAHMPELEEYLK